MQGIAASRSADVMQPATNVTPLPDLSSLYYRVVRSSLATTVHDGSGALALFNSACSALLGYDASELAALHPSALLHPDDTHALTVATERAYSALGGLSDARLRMVRKDGRSVVVDVAMSRVLVENRRYLLIESTPVAPAA